MASNTRDIKRRIKSVTNISQITRAMQLVATSKMKRAQKKSTDADAFAYGALEILQNLTKAVGDSRDLPFWKQRETGKIAVVLISTDRGFCGGLNINLAGTLLKQIKEWKKEVDIITVGRKGQKVAKKAGLNIIADFSGIGDHFSIKEVVPIRDMITKEFEEEKYEKIYIAYNQFINTLTQTPTIRQILPVEEDGFKKISETNNKVQEHLFEKDTKGSDEPTYVFEPSAEEVFKKLVPYLIEVDIYKALLENQASEHSARMMAMKNATDKAGELIDDLKLAYNQARQAGITREIAEISSGAAATAKR